MSHGNLRLRRGFLRLSAWLGMAGPIGDLLVRAAIQPVVDFAPLAGLEDNETLFVTVDGDGGFIVATVPEGELWRVRWIRYGLSSGTYTIDQVRIFGAAGLALDETAVTTTRIVGAGAFQPDFYIYPGQGLDFVVSGHSVSGVAFVQLRKFVFSMDPLGTN